MAFQNPSAEFMLVDTSQKTAPVKRKTGDRNSSRSGTSKSSINNPKLLEKVEDAIRRSILPELRELKKDQKAHTNRSKFERDTAISRDCERCDLKTRRSKKHLRASDLTTPYLVVENDSNFWDTTLGKEKSKGRDDHSRERESESHGNGGIALSGWDNQSPMFAEELEFVPSVDNSWEALMPPAPSRGTHPFEQALLDPQTWRSRSEDVTLPRYGNIPVRIWSNTRNVWLQTDAMADTGCLGRDANLVSMSFLMDDLQYQFIPYPPDQQTPFYGPGGGEGFTIGSVELKIQKLDRSEKNELVRGDIRRLIFFVVHDKSFDILLGREFLEINEAFRPYWGHKGKAKDQSKSDSVADIAEMRRRDMQRQNLLQSQQLQSNPHAQGYHPGHAYSQGPVYLPNGLSGSNVSSL